VLRQSAPGFSQLSITLAAIAGGRQRSAGAPGRDRAALPGENAGPRRTPSPVRLPIGAVAEGAP